MTSPNTIYVTRTGQASMCPVRVMSLSHAQSRRVSLPLPMSPRRVITDVTPDYVPDALICADAMKGDA